MFYDDNNNVSNTAIPKYKKPLYVQALVIKILLSVTTKQQKCEEESFYCHHYCQTMFKEKFSVITS